MEDERVAARGRRGGAEPGEATVREAIADRVGTPVVETVPDSHNVEVAGTAVLVLLVHGPAIQRPAVRERDPA